MSLEDIKPTDTVIYINNKPYKIAYDFNSISRLLELFECSFSNLAGVIQDIEAIGDLPRLLKFCHVGFLKHHPDFSLQEVKEYGFYTFLYKHCCLQFLKCMSEPDEWEKTIYQNKPKTPDSIKKKSWISRIFGIKH